MPLKTLNTPNTLSLWNREFDCAETELIELAKKLALELKEGDRVLLEGPMGAGKTTFSRHLLAALQITQPAEGSPTFAIAHEYHSPQGGVVHIDYYRLRSAQEIDEAGIPAYYWERNLIVISEWLSSWPEFEEQVLQSGRIWRVTLGFHSENESIRKVSLSTTF